MFRIAAYVIAAAIATLGPVATNAQVTIEDRLAPGQPPVIAVTNVIGGDQPEYSLAWYRYAIERGIDMVNIPVKLTGDGQYIVMRRRTLTSTTNVREIFPEGSPLLNAENRFARRYFVRDFNLEDVKQLRLNDPEGREHPVPTLGEVLDLIDGQLLAWLSLPYSEGEILRDRDLESLAALLEDHGTSNLMLFSVQDPARTRAAVATTGIKANVYLTGVPDYSTALQQAVEAFGSDMAMVEVETRNGLTPEFVAEARDLGVWISYDGRSVEDPALLRGDPGPWQNALNSGAAVLLTRQPDALLKLLDR